LGSEENIAMSRLEIRPARSERERMRFIRFAWQVYAQDPCWVPPLTADLRQFINPKKGVFFQNGDAELLLAYRDGKPVGRLSVQVSRRHHAIYNDGKGFFGFFECMNDPEAAVALVRQAEAYLAQHGCTRIEGPYNFTIYDEIGVLVEGFDSMPYVMNVHNPPYYGELLEGVGLRKAVDWYAFRVKREAVESRWPERLARLSDHISSRKGVTIRPMDRAHFWRDATIVKTIFNQAWSRNFGHVPMTDNEFKRVTSALKHLIIPELSFVAEINGQPVGFALSTYDANLVVREIDGRLFPFGFIKLLRQTKKVKRFRMMLMGVLERYRNRGYEVAFYVQTIRKGIEMGMVECEVSNIVETNEPMLKSLANLPTERHKVYRIYEKSL
jgi:hypothetical protein